MDRQARSAAGDKSDKIDRKILAMFLVTFHRDLHPLRPDAPEIISLRIACQDRLRLVEERTAKISELRAVLKVHYPAFLGCFNDPDTQIALEFLQAFPTQSQMLKLTERRFRNWLRRHHYTRVDRVDEMLRIRAQPPLPVSDHLQAAKAPLVIYLARSLLTLKVEIAEREQQVTQQFDELPEADWIRSLPRAGPPSGQHCWLVWDVIPNVLRRSPMRGP